MRVLLSIITLSFLSACATSPTQVVTELDPTKKGIVNIQNVNVTYSDLAQENLIKLDQKAQEKGSKSSNPEALQYQPLKQALQQIAKDHLEERDSDQDLLANVTIEIDNLKLINPAAAILIGDTDQLAGSVRITNVQSQEVLTEFYTDIIKGSGGLLGMAIRGGGVREKLALQFSDNIGDQLGFEKAPK